jgi:hypothetical protein
MSVSRGMGVRSNAVTMSMLALAIQAMLVAHAAVGATITVRKDGTGNYTTIQAGLDAAAAGDTVSIGPGTYTEVALKPSVWLGAMVVTHGYVGVNDLTIIGAGADLTIIGPALPPADCWDFDPQGFTCEQDGTLRLADLTVRNCGCDVRVAGTLFMDRCVMAGGSSGVVWEAAGNGGWIRNSRFTTTTPVPCQAFDENLVWALLDVRCTPSGNSAIGLQVEDCAFEHAYATTFNIDGITFRRCDFTGGETGLASSGSSHVTVEDCRFTEHTGASVSMWGGASGSTVCTIRNSTVDGGACALKQATRCRFDVANTRLVGGSRAVVEADAGSDACSVRGCDLVQGAGPFVACGTGGAAIVHDFRDNYWGTADAAVIAAGITDHDDNAIIGATVLFSPFSGQSVPAESMEWGSVKALYR